MGHNKFKSTSEQIDALKYLARNCLKLFAPPPQLTGSDWADKYFYMSAESSAEPGRWKTLPYQKEILDSMTDQITEMVTVKKSARVGYTKMLCISIAYRIHQDPCPQLLVQPTIDDAEGFSKEEIAPMIRDNSTIRNLVAKSKSKDSSSTLKKKSYPGGPLHIIGANSALGFRRITVKEVKFDEIDAYPPSAGQEGDQIKLGIRRTDTYWDRKIILGSTPVNRNTSKIEASWENSDQRFRYYPCPHCNFFQVLKFENLKFEKENPLDAQFVCIGCGVMIEHSYLQWMDERAYWKASKPEVKGHAGYHLWSAMSYSPNATWGHIAKEFLDTKNNPEQLKTFVNTWLGEAWEERGDAPEWERIFNRPKYYKRNVIPAKGLFLVAGMDVQKDRFEIEIIAFGRKRESYSVDYRIIHGGPESESAWKKVALLLDEEFEHETSSPMKIIGLGIDSGYSTNEVYTFARNYQYPRVIPIKGIESMKQPLGTPNFVDISMSGKTIKRGVKLLPVGVSVIKDQFYTYLRHEQWTRGSEIPAGYCFFPEEYDEEYYKQLTAESKIIRRNRKGYSYYEWIKTRARNESLDCRIYGMAVAHFLGMYRWSEEYWNQVEDQVRPEKEKQFIHKEAPVKKSKTLSRGVSLY